MIVVIPTCRGIVLEHLGPLIDSGCRFIVVDDGPGSVRVEHPAFEVYAWPDRARLLGRREIAIPRGNGACRDLGFYVAWRESDANEIIVALDDDCRVGPGFPGRVLANLRPGRHPVVAGSGRHFNIFDLYADPKVRAWFPRGFPYATRPGYRRWSVAETIDADVLMNLGLWRGALDVNAVDRLAGEDPVYPDASLEIENAVVPRGVLASLCSGSMQFKRSIIPAIYQLPMDVPILPGWTINRYGDIWGGFILKKLMDCRGDFLSVGGPLVDHLQIGPVAVNGRKEHLCHLVGDEFIDLLDRACADLAPDDYLGMLGHLREELQRLAPKTSPILRIYLTNLLPALTAWISALSS